MECHVSAFSRVGGREHNEDACGYLEKNGVVCCVLADGAGGHLGGEIASRTCVQSVLEEFALRPGISTEMMNGMLDKANRAVLKMQQEDATLADMRSTLVVLLFDACHRVALWGHIGDSRLYLFRRGTVHMRTRDHSLVQSMVEGGMIRDEDAHAHADANVLFSSVGLQDGFTPCVLDTPIHVDDGDAFLLCSDGVWGVIDDLEIERCLCCTTSSEDWLRCLETKVSAQAGPDADNFSAMGVRSDDSDLLRTVPADASSAHL